MLVGASALLEPKQEGFRRTAYELPGQYATAKVLRVILGEVLAGFSQLRDAQMIATEFAANAAREYCPCCPNGSVRMTVERGDKQVRLEIGSPFSPHQDRRWDEETILAYTYGLAIVRELAVSRTLDVSGRTAGEYQVWSAQITGDWS